MLKSCSGQPHPLLSRRCLQGGDVTNSAASTGVALMRDPCARLARPSSHCHMMILMETGSIYIQSMSTVHEEHEEGANVQVRHNYTHKAKPQELPFHVFQLNPLPLEAEHLNCGKAVIFKLDILVISEGSNNVIKLTSIRTLSPSCFTQVSMLLTADTMLVGYR